jgi:hypothetical protein
MIKLGESAVLSYKFYMQTHLVENLQNMAKQTTKSLVVPKKSFQTFIPSFLFNNTGFDKKFSIFFNKNF